nr:40s ribosomal protein s15a-5 [Quercus suber]
MGRRILNDALRSIVNAEKRGKATVELKPISNVISSFLKIMKDRGYIKDYQVYDPHRVGRITVELQGRVKDCKALTYRQDIKARDIENYRLRMLPTHQWGYVVITTPDGVLDHEEAIKKNVGGQGEVNCVKWDPTGSLLASCSDDITAKVVDATPSF